MKKYLTKSKLLVKDFESRVLTIGKRRLIINRSGRWYIFLTLAIGLTAIAASNNILYLLLSFLLGGLILSGVLSEYAVSNIEVKWKRRQAIAGEDLKDEIVIFNRGRFPIFCVEVGEWSGKAILPMAFIPILPHRKQITVPTRGHYIKRGVHTWKGIAVQTGYPYGFAIKIRWFDSPGSRLIWPTLLSRRENDMRHFRKAILGSGEIIDGEIRNAVPEDDYRHIVWSYTFKTDQPMVRVRSLPRSDIELDFVLSKFGPDGFESEVSRLATIVHNTSVEDPIVLNVQSKEGRERIRGKFHILDYLATVTRDA